MDARMKAKVASDQLNETIKAHQERMQYETPPKAPDELAHINDNLTNLESSFNENLTWQSYKKWLKCQDDAMQLFISISEPGKRNNCWSVQNEITFREQLVKKYAQNMLKNQRHENMPLEECEQSFQDDVHAYIAHAPDELKNASEQHKKQAAIREMQNQWKNHLHLAWDPQVANAIVDCMPWTSKSEYDTVMDEDQVNGEFHVACGNEEVTIDGRPSNVLSAVNIWTYGSDGKGANWQIKPMQDNQDAWKKCAPLFIKLMRLKTMYDDHRRSIKEPQSTLQLVIKALGEIDNQQRTEDNPGSSAQHAAQTHQQPSEQPDVGDVTLEPDTAPDREPVPLERFADGASTASGTEILVAHTAPEQTREAGPEMALQQIPEDFVDKTAAEDWLQNVPSTHPVFRDVLDGTNSILRVRRRLRRAEEPDNLDKILMDPYLVYEYHDRAGRACPIIKGHPYAWDYRAQLYRPMRYDAVRAVFHDFTNDWTSLAPNTWVHAQETTRDAYSLVKVIAAALNDRDALVNALDWKTQTVESAISHDGEQLYPYSPADARVVCIEGVSYGRRDPENDYAWISTMNDVKECEALSHTNV